MTSKGKDIDIQFVHSLSALFFFFFFFRKNYPFCPSTGNNNNIVILSVLSIYWHFICRWIRYQLSVDISPKSFAVDVLRKLWLNNHPSYFIVQIDLNWVWVEFPRKWFSCRSEMKGDDLLFNVRETLHEISPIYAESDHAIGSSNLSIFLVAFIWNSISLFFNGRQKRCSFVGHHAYRTTSLNFQKTHVTCQFPINISKQTSQRHIYSCSSCHNAFIYCRRQCWFPFSNAM